MALDKPTKQSSTRYGGFSRRAVDGKKNPSYRSGSCTHTSRQSKPWWRVDLGSKHKVVSVALTNRKDCCSNRLRDVEIKVTKSDKLDGDASSL